MRRGRLLRVVAVLGVIVAIPVVLLLEGTIYIVRDSGYTALTFRRQRNHRVSPEQLRQVIGRLLARDEFDELFASDKDDYWGLMVSMESGVPVLSVDLTAGTTSDKEREKSLVAEMKAAGHAPGSRSEWNEGVMVTLQFNLPNTVEAIAKAIDISLTQMQGREPAEHYVAAFHSSSGPGTAKGIYYQLNPDSLADLR